MKISYNGGTGNITDVAGNALASLTYYIGGSGDNTINAAADGAGVRIDANGGNDILRGSDYSDIINGGAGNDDINGKLASTTGPNILIGGDGADYIQGQSHLTIWNATDLANGLYNDVIFTGSQTRGVAATSGTWAGTLYAEGTDVITTPGMSAAFVSYFEGQLTATFAPIFNAANIVDGWFGADTIVASTAKDVFLFQTGTTGANDGISISGKTIEHFQIGTDVIAALNYNGGGDHVFVGSQAAADTFNALHNGDAVLASSQWTWALDTDKSDAGTLTYANTAIIEGGTAANANMTIHLAGVQGTITSVDSFFYGGA